MTIGIFGVGYECCTCMTVRIRSRSAPMNQPASMKINAAIRAGLDDCLASESPFICLAAFLKRLRGDPSWTEDEVQEVQFRSVRILTRLAAGDSTSDLLGSH